MNEPAEIPPLLFGEFFYELRREDLKVGLSEWMALLEALKGGAVNSLDDFYYVGRALLIKSEAHFDTYDQAFARIFRGRTLTPAAVKSLMDWLEHPILADLTAEQLAAIEKLPLDELRELFEQRLKEQDERHDGGNKWVGTGGTSPFGHGGQHPAGVRVGGKGGNRSAIQIASARDFKAYRHDRVLDVRSISVALKKLRRLTRRHQDLELDIDESIDSTCKNAGELTLEFTPPRRNEARVLLLMDTGGSMDPYAKLVERLFSAANGLSHWRQFEPWAFHNCVYERLEPALATQDDGIFTGDLFRRFSKETYLIFVGDAYMAPSELLDAWGAIHYYHHNRTPGVVWLHKLRQHFTRSIWLNPMPERAWGGWTVKIIRQIFPMFSLSVEGIEQGMQHLLRGTPDPLPRLADIYPELGEFEDMDLSMY